MGQLRLFGRHLRQIASQAGLFCQSEIHQLGTGFAQHYAGRFQVAAHDAEFVRLGERICDFSGDAKGLRSGQGPLVRRRSNVSPSTSSITRMSTPSRWPMSCSVQM